MKNSTFFVLTGAALVLVLLAPLGLIRGAAEVDSLAAPELPPLRGEEVAVVTPAPNVPPPIDRDYATTVHVELETIEVTKRLADGVDYTFWTFGGNVPGDFIRVREGDEVVFTLKNHPTSVAAHNIDLHAVSGPGGGAAATFVGPNQAKTFSFRALNPGLYVYHCAVAPVGLHIANGMYGLILVEPKEGLPEVDREFYVMQGELYTEEAMGTPGLLTESIDNLMDERPTYYVMNGAFKALTGDKALQVEVGDTARIYFGVGGPNKASSFHVIGEIFDHVHPWGSLSSPAVSDVQTVLVPPGGATVVDLTFEVPGSYIMVDHALSRVDRGAAGIIEVTGEQNPDVFRGDEHAHDHMDH